MSDLEPRLRERFTAYRVDVTTQVAGPGPDQARRTLRRRRQTRAVAVAAAAVVLVLAPVVANAALNSERRTPTPAETVSPTDPPTTGPLPTPSITGTPSATPSTAPSAPDGRISRAQLLAARVDLPKWPSETPERCTTSDVRLRGDAKPTDVPWLSGVAIKHGDLDGDGADETVALIGCRGYGETWAKQVVAFDRDRDGRIVTMGRVVRTGDGFDDILGTEIASGAVQVRVGDIQPCCSTPKHLVREQVRTYRWTGEEFRQTDGPTKFGKDPRLTDLRLTMTHEFVDAPGGRKLTTVLTVTNAGPVDALKIQFNGLDVGERAGGDWSRCERDAAAADDNLSCRLPGVPAGESRRYTFVYLVPDRSGADARARSFFVFHYDDQGREWPDLKKDDNSAKLPGLL
ncbi:hypothetical protein F4558_005964 [Micromonospora profundi]|uniref:hypothetical protein n=1 Tax=Micromonospora profundi TaxID=1420889 RepID=UPI00143AB3D7|nr:hypothetical protein [Micromonospora profundi]NJC16138.1 hypothetical protein [Micromonospora profundi]